MGETERMPRGVKILVVLVFVILAFGVGSAVRELTDFDAAGVGAAIGLPAIIALFGMFWIAKTWKDALTASFVVAYLIFLSGILAIFVFGETNFELEGGARVIVDNFTALVGVVMAAYFGQEAVKAGAEAFRAAKEAEANATRDAAIATARMPSSTSPRSTV